LAAAKTSPVWAFTTNAFVDCVPLSIPITNVLIKKNLSEKTLTASGTIVKASALFSLAKCL
ncbi:MAG: hypothetical protein IKS95_06475, partial [Verrucomicrobia bacterium]|nr:hypothetical protein [Verrucomicrobiota bacterium]